MPKVSIIVPVYNSEKSISRCIDSILAQTFSDLELILVNDGSQDNSGKICDEYAKKDNRIIVIHKDNGGVSSARNVGLEIAKGEYVTFVDSDDTISINYLSSFSYSSDFEIAGLETIEKDKKVDFPTNEIFLENTIEISNWFLSNSHRKYLTSICSKLFLKKNIESISLKFNTSLKYGEDTIFIYNYLASCENLYMTPVVIYQYHVNSGKWNQKYSLNAQDCQNHLIIMTNVLEQLEQKWGLKLPSKLKSAHYPTYLHLFYTHLKFLPRDDKKKEIKSFRKYSGKLQLFEALSLKNYIYWRLLPSALVANK